MRSWNCFWKRLVIDLLFDFVSGLGDILASCADILTDAIDSVASGERECDDGED